ncbi:MAG: ROK family protein [Planctomycetota bacterium]
MSGEREGVRIGVDLGGTHFQVGVVAPGGELLGRERGKTGADDGVEAVVRRLAESITAAAREAGLDDAGALPPVGIGAPGVIDAAGGTVVEAPNLRWNDVPLGAMLRDALGDRAPTISIDNDVNAAAWGEWTLGGHNGETVAGRLVRDMLAVWVGTGIGGGLVLDGHLYRGHFNSAGEIGHAPAFPAFPLGRRKLEQVCSRHFVQSRLRDLIAGNTRSLLSEIVADGDLDTLTAADLATAYERGDELTRRVLDESADLLGVALATTVTTLSIPLVVLGGGLVETMGDAYVNRVAAALRADVFPGGVRAVRVVPTALRENAGLLGAAMLGKTG